MKTFKELKENGYVIRPSHPHEAIDCTVVESDRPFYFYNPKHYETLDEIVQNAKMSMQEGNKHRIIIAGECARFEAQGSLPFTLIDLNEWADFLSLHDEKKALEKTMQESMEKIMGLASRGLKKHQQWNREPEFHGQKPQKKR